MTITNTWKRQKAFLLCVLVFQRLAVKMNGMDVKLIPEADEVDRYPVTDTCLDQWGGDGRLCGCRGGGWNGLGKGGGWSGLGEGGVDWERVEDIKLTKDAHF